MGMKKDKKLKHRAENGYYCLRDGHVWVRKVRTEVVNGEPVHIDTDEFVCSRCPAMKKAT